MAIDLKTFASGDTDYIAKMNSNVSALTAAINALQAQAGAAGAGTAISTGIFINSLFNGADCLIGAESYQPTQDVTSLSVAGGGMYLAGGTVVVQSIAPTTFNFTGQTYGRKYIVITNTGLPTLSSSPDAGAAWSVFWTGSAFAGQPERVCPAIFDATESTAARVSDRLGEEESPPEPVTYHSLDDRLEAIEELAAEAHTAAVAIVAQSRKIGATVDGSPGVKGAIQIDFGGTIVGWSIIADQVGDIVVEVSRASSSPPDDVPAIPDPVADKISASAPIKILGAQSASGGEDDVDTWDTQLLPWDVVQFKVAGATTITRATLYLRIQQGPTVTPFPFVEEA